MMVTSFPAPLFPEQTTLPCFCPHPAKLHQHPASSLWILKITRRIPDKNLGLLITTTFISAASFISQALGFCCILCQAAWICDLFALIGNNDQRSFPDADLGILSRKEVIADSDGNPLVMSAPSSSYLAWRMLTPQARSVWLNTEKWYPSSQGTTTL